LKGRVLKHWRSGVRGEAKYLLAVLLSMLIFLASPQLTIAQPARWDLKVLFLPLGLPTTFRGDPLWLEDHPDTYFPGETANLTFQLVNVDCSRRAQRPHVAEFRQAWEENLTPIFDRARLLNETGFISNYRVNYSNVVVFGDRRLADWRLEIYGYCEGSPIFVEWAAVWFAWPEIGRAAEARVRVDKSLAALKPLDYIFKNDINSSITFFTVRFNFPAQVKPQHLGIQPTVTLSLRYPSGFSYQFEYTPSDKEPALAIWGLRGAAYGDFRLSPYRTFNLRVTDYEGMIPLAGAEITMSAYVYPFKMKITTNASGYAEFRRIPDAYVYDIKVDYNVSMLGEKVSVLSTSYEAIDLAMSQNLRTELYTLRVSPVDRLGRVIEGAIVYLEPAKAQSEPPHHMAVNRTTGGYASFYIVPTGNYTVSVEWRGLSVYRGHRYVGAHPTYGFAPNSFAVAASVDDLRVSAVDRAGNLVGAVFSVSGPNYETSYFQVEAPDGVLSLPQMPITDYLVAAVNQSTVYNARSEATGLVRPGSPARLELPIYGVSLRALSSDGKPLGLASVKLHSVSATAGTDGRTVFAGVPQGVYQVEVIYGGSTVYTGRLEVRDNVSKDLLCAVYDVKVRFLTGEGVPVIVDWHLTGPWGEFTGTGDGFSRELLPEGEYRLMATYRREGVEVLALNKTASASDLRGVDFTLPLGRLVLRVTWDDGQPFEGFAEILGSRLRLRDGFVEAPVLPYGRYNVSVISGGDVLLLKAELMHEGREETIKIPSTTIVVKVVDVLRRPLQGAEVKLYSPRSPWSPLVIAATGPDGAVRLTRLPATLSPFRVVTTYGGERLESWVSGAEATVVFPALEVGGTLLEAGLVLVIVGGLVALAVSIELLRNLLKRRRGEQG
jgi:hypothetical protein